MTTSYLTMPKLSPTMEQGTIVKWHKQEGDWVASGDLLVEVATDKATVEYHALDEGWVRYLLVPEGKEVEVNHPIALLTPGKEDSIDLPSPSALHAINSQQSQENENSDTVDVPPRPREELNSSTFSLPRFVPEAPLPTEPFSYPTDRWQSRVIASPLAKKMAREQGLDLSTVKGSGPQGRIISTDLVRAQRIGLIQFGKRQAPTIPAGTYEEQAMTPMRKVIATRLQGAKASIPHFYVNQVVDAQPLVTVRDQMKVHGMTLSVNDFILRACALALRQHPSLNAGFHSVNQTIVRFKTIDIAVAVGVEGGLITPIIRYADYKHISELSSEMRQLAQRAREGQLEPQEYKGGSFTISNLGMYGVTEFQAILNPPQAAILAVGAIQEVPVVKEGAVIPGKRIHLTLSVDHRVIDGIAAAQFLQTLKLLLENASGLLL